MTTAQDSLVAATPDQGRTVSVVAVAGGWGAIERAWSMPNSETFSMPPVARWVAQYLAASKTSIDPFARNKRLATHTNDIDPTTEAEHHMDARAFLKMLIAQEVRADLVLFDPPYSPRQISECYRSAGLPVGRTDTQNARLYAECRSLIKQLAAPSCRVLSFGWNSTGMGAGWTRERTLLVNHGAAHNDTICVCDHLTLHPNIAVSQPGGQSNE